MGGRTKAVHPPNRFFVIFGQKLKKLVFPARFLRVYWPMEKSGNPIPWVSGGLALLVGLLFTAVTVPNYPPHPIPILPILSAAFLPALCIFTLGRRWIIFDWLAWVFLSFLLVGIFMH
jgi:hypothetical protein